MLEIQARTKIPAKIYGKEFQLTRPTVKEIELLQEETEKTLSDKDKTKVLCKWISNLGLPLDVIEEMELGHLLEVVEFVTGTKKK